MSTTDDGRWSISVGPHGAKVRAREHPKRGSNVYLFTWDPELGGNRKESLGFKVRDADGKLIPEHVKKAKEEAGKLSNQLITGEAPTDEEEEPVTTLGEVADLFRTEVVADMTGRHKKGTGRDVGLIETYLGRSFELETLSQREWGSLRRDRASGRIDSHGNRVREKKDRKKRSARTVQKTLKVLRHMCRFAARWRRKGGSYLLDRDPTKGLPLPKVDDPKRPGCSDELLAALLEEAPKVTRRVRGNGKNEEVRTCLRELIVVAAGTGHRIGALVRLRWSDWSPEQGRHGTLRWRGEHQKDGRTRVTSVPLSVREALEAHRQRMPGVGEAYIFPAPDSDGHLRVDVAGKWLREAETEIREHVNNWGWHAFRRRWADRMKDKSPVDTAHMGGWRGPHTMQTVYQRSSVEDMDRVLADVPDPGRVAAEGQG